MALPKRRDTVVIGVLVACHHPVRHLLMRGALNPARRWFPRTVRIQQQRHHHHRMIRRLATPIPLLVHVRDRTQIELTHDVQHEQGQMAFRQPLAHVGRQQQALIQIVFTEGFPHPPRLHSAPPLQQSSPFTNGLGAGFSPTGS
jgi:hypothetical protein